MLEGWRLFSRLLRLLSLVKSLFFVKALYRLQEVLNQRVLHLFAELEGLAEIVGHFADVVAHMYADSSRLRGSHVHVDVKQELPLLGLMETWRFHFSEFYAVVLLAASPLLRLFLSLFALSVRLTHSAHLLLKAFGHWSLHGRMTVQVRPGVRIRAQISVLEHTCHSSYALSLRQSRPLMPGAAFLPRAGPSRHRRRAALF